MYAVALTDRLPSVVAAVTVCVPIVVGAVYRPVLVIVPTDADPPTTPSTDQFTVGEPPPGRDGVNCCVWPGVSASWRGVRRTPVYPFAGLEYDPSLPRASIARTRYV